MKCKRKGSATKRLRHTHELSCGRREATKEREKMGKEERKGRNDAAKAKGTSGVGEGRKTGGNQGTRGDWEEETKGTGKMAEQV